VAVAHQIRCSHAQRLCLIVGPLATEIITYEIFGAAICLTMMKNENNEYHFLYYMGNTTVHLLTLITDLCVTYDRILTFRPHYCI